MGSLGSGRRKRHHITNECIPVDTMQLRKHGLLEGSQTSISTQMNYTVQTKTVSERIQETHHELNVLVERYAPEGDPPGHYASWGAIGHLTLCYSVRIGKEEKAGQRVDIALVATHPNFGGARYWLLAPCCGRRVRAVYLPTFGGVESILPKCRCCLRLHYASQQQSYIERHKTYERYLLANYGYQWAEMDYLCLREHYQEITPAIENARRRSVLEMELKMLYHLIRWNQMMLKTHTHALLSLKSEDDRQLYVDHLVKEHGEGYALDLVRMLGMSFTLERDALGMSSEVFKESPDIVERLSLLAEEADDEVSPAFSDLQTLFVRKQVVRDELARLELAA